MNNLMRVLQEELDAYRVELSTEKGRKEAAEERIRSDQEILIESNLKIESIDKNIQSVLAKIEAIEEDAKAYKVAAEGFLKGLDDDEAKLNFCTFCETLGIEIEIDSDENAETDEEAEEAGEIVQTGT